MQSCEPPAALNVLLWPVVAPKNRVGGSAAFSFVFAFQFIGETLDTPAENGGCGYDFASGVHKYLYAEDDPVNGVDPSGNAVYFVTRHFDWNSTTWADTVYNSVNSGHAYLLFTSTSDPGSPDPFKSGYAIWDTFSWHPNTFDGSSPEFSGGSGSPVPGRIWEDSLSIQPPRGVMTHIWLRLTHTLNKRF